MPHLVRMDKKYRKKGLKVIADERQGSPVEDIEEVAKDNRAEFSITKGTTCPPGMGGIPHAVVFDSTGKLIFSGHPSEDNFDRSVKNALKDVDAEPEEDEGGLPPVAKPVIDERAWTNSDGRTIKAAVMRVEGDKVVFKMKGREIPYPLEKLSDEGQDAIKEATEEKDEDE